MTLIAVPNVSEGRDTRALGRFERTIARAGANVLDVHADAAHHRSVFTVTGRPSELAEAMAELASATATIDLELHRGVHPRTGSFDVCAIVPHGTTMDRAVAVARDIAETIWRRTDTPIYLYGEAATRPEARDLPNIRRGGIAALTERAQHDLPPDFGGPEIDPSRGVVCVGARAVLIAFNLWVDGSAELASEIARRIRSAAGGLPGVRALGVPIDRATSQVSTNLVEPARTGIDEVFRACEAIAGELGASIVRTEIVGLPPERYLPDPNGKAARLLIEPSRSLEDALERRAR